MSVLTGKHILVIGDETEQISKVEAALITYGADITSATCENADPNSIATQGADLILINHLHEGVHCRHLLEKLQGDHIDNVPVFALVQPDDAHINEAFILGASDYITPNEDVHNVVEKMKLMLGGSSISPQKASIDITPTATNNTEGIRVFAVEDDPLLRNLLAVKFEKSGLPFQVAEDATGVVDKVLAFQPQIVILDLMLPGASGFDVLQDLKKSAAKDIPVVVFSNKDTQVDRARAEELGAEAFYVKAMTDLSQLIGVIEKHASQ